MKFIKLTNQDTFVQTNAGKTPVESGGIVFIDIYKIAAIIGTKDGSNIYLSLTELCIISVKETPEKIGETIVELLNSTRRR